MIAARSASVARAALRAQAGSLALRQQQQQSMALRRRWASSSSGSGASSGGSDSLWAITSVVVFGSLFVYLTSPSGKGHAKGHTPTPHKTESFDMDDEALHNLSKTEDHSDSHLEGNKFLAARAHSPDSDAAPTQKKTKDAPTKSDDTTFKTGVAHAKDGDHISDPKKVVAAAQAKKQDAAANKKGAKADDKEEGGDDEKEEKKDDKDEDDE